MKKLKIEKSPKDKESFFYFNLEQDFESYRNYISEFFLSFAAQAKNHMPILQINCIEMCSWKDYELKKYYFSKKQFIMKLQD